MQATATTHRLRIDGMDCADCALTIEKAISKLDGVETASVNFTTQTLEATGQIATEDIARRVQELGYEAATAASRPTAAACVCIA